MPENRAGYGIRRDRGAERAGRWERADRPDDLTAMPGGIMLPSALRDRADACTLPHRCAPPVRATEPRAGSRVRLGSPIAGAGCSAPRALLLLALLVVHWARVRPGYDPYGWLVWGHLTVHGKLDTNGAPSWKPLPVPVHGPVRAGRPPRADAVDGHRVRGLAGRRRVRLAGGLHARRCAARAPLRRLRGRAGRRRCAAGRSTSTCTRSSAPSRTRSSSRSAWRPSTASSAGATGGRSGSGGWPRSAGPRRGRRWASTCSGRGATARDAPADGRRGPADSACSGSGSRRSPRRARSRPPRSPSARPRELHGNKITGTFGRFIGLDAASIKLAALIAVVLAALRRDRAVLLLAGGVALWVVVEIAFALHGWPAVPRYMYEAAGGVCVLAGVFAGRVILDAPVVLARALGRLASGRRGSAAWADGRRAGWLFAVSLHRPPPTRPAHRRAHRPARPARPHARDPAARAGRPAPRGARILRLRAPRHRDRVPEHPRLGSGHEHRLALLQPPSTSSEHPHPIVNMYPHSYGWQVFPSDGRRRAGSACRGLTTAHERRADARARRSRSAAPAGAGARRAGRRGRS